MYTKVMNDESVTVAFASPYFSSMTFSGFQLSWFSDIYLFVKCSVVF